MKYHLNSIYLLISHFSVAPSQGFLYGLMNSMVGCQNQDHSIHMRLDWIHLHLNQKNMPLPLPMDWAYLSYSPTLCWLTAQAFLLFGLFYHMDNNNTVLWSYCCLLPTLKPFVPSQIAPLVTIDVSEDLLEKKPSQKSWKRVSFPFFWQT